MPKRKRSRSGQSFAAAIALLCAAGAPAAALDPAPLPMIHTDGTHFVDPAGHAVLLRGANLGNYLMLESWMWGGTLKFKDGAQFYRTLRQRFGDDAAEQLITTYRNSWITPRDFDLIKSFGFNTVRLPFDYRLIQTDTAPFPTRPDAFRWLDHAVQMAQAAGVYVILDLHGTPGGQSNEDHTGEAGQDHLWTSDPDQQRTVAVWKTVAEHFKDNPTVAAYDLINEPYGDHHQDCRPVLARLLPQITQAIRSTGDDHVVFFPGTLHHDIAFYGNPHQAGLTNVAFTEHYYPGLFGSTPALETQARVLNLQMPAKAAYLQHIQSPYYVGEFNVVLASEAPDRLMRVYYDTFAHYGWAGTMWSYKLISAAGGVHPSAWDAVTNAAPLPTLDLQTSSYADLHQFFASMATVPLTPEPALRDALTTPHPAPLPLAHFAAPADKSDEDANPTAAAPTDPPPAESDALGPNLLINPCFQQPGPTPETAGGWNHWGPGLTRQTAPTPTPPGNGQIIYRHADIDDAAPSGLWQDVAVEPGRRYRFSLRAHRDPAPNTHDPRTLELRLESITPTGPVTLNSQTFDISKLAPSAEWSHLSLPGTSITPTLRVLAIITPAKTAPRAGTVTLQDAHLTPVNDDDK